MKDVAYLESPYRLNQRKHQYGDGVHVIANPVLATLLARLCDPKTTQPAVNRLVRRLYEDLVVSVVNDLLPRRVVQLETRMVADTERARYEAEQIDTSVKAISVDIARAGILPSLVCYEMLNELLLPANVRQDHLMISRSTDDMDHVKGARITGGKIGGPVDDAVVLFPDPMGATGSSLSEAIAYYKEQYGNNARAMATLNLIVTPEFIKRIKSDHPDVHIYALRLDRGMSADDVLRTVPGERWDEESGLNDKDYIVPGGGGFGEIMNNAWV